MSIIKKIFKWLFNKFKQIKPHHDSQPYSYYQICQKELKDRRLS